VKTPLTIFLLAVVFLLIFGWILAMSLKVALIGGGVALVGIAIVTLEELYAAHTQEKFFRPGRFSKYRRKKEKPEVVDFEPFE
jgi:small neutral amino acid transporter SnatA (MarC family)